MILKLYVQFTDSFIMSVTNEPPINRVVCIELTKEQCEKLTPKWVGNSGGNEYYEERRPLALQEE